MMEERAEDQHVAEAKVDGSVMPVPRRKGVTIVVPGDDYIVGHTNRGLDIGDSRLSSSSSSSLSFSSSLSESNNGGLPMREVHDESSNHSRNGSAVDAPESATRTT